MMFGIWFWWRVIVAVVMFYVVVVLFATYPYLILAIVAISALTGVTRWLNRRVDNRR